MSEPAPGIRVIEILLLRRMRALVRPGRYLGLAAAIAATYALFSMLVGGMLVVYPTSNISPFYEIVASGFPWWNYPALLVVTQSWALELPFLPTISMLWVSIGVGLGMAVAARLVIRLVRQRRDTLVRPTALGSLAGLTPAMIGLLLLGACCSISASAIAGVSLIGQATGSNVDDLLVNTWYLGLVQLAVLYVALVAQEELIVVYGGLFGFAAGLGLSFPEGVSPSSLPRQRAGQLLLRWGLAVGGLTWLLAGFTYWFEPTWFGPYPSTPGPATWFSLLFQHGLLGVLALGAALFPSRLADAVRRSAHRTWGVGVRAGLGISGASLLIPSPAALGAAGVVGLGNELLALLGAPAAWGAVAPPAVGPVALAFRWALQFGLLGAFALSLAAWPTSVARYLAAPVAGRGGTAATEPAPVTWASAPRVFPSGEGLSPAEEPPARAAAEVP